MLEKFKNLKVKTKLNIGFSLLLVCMLIMSVVCIAFMYNLYAINKSINSKIIGTDHRLYQVTESLYRQRISVYNMAVYDEENPALARMELQNLYNEENVFDQVFADYSEELTGEAMKNSTQIRELYYNEFAALKKEFVEAFNRNDKDAMNSSLDEINVCGDDISVYLEQASEIKIAYSKNQADKSQKQFMRMLIIIAAFIVSAVIAAWIIIRRITRSVRGPITRISKVAGQVAGSGNFNFNDKVINEMKIDASYNDEIGLTTKAFSKMMEDFIEKKDVLERVAAGDLTVRANVISSEDTLGNSINLMIDSLRGIVNQIEETSAQINKSAEQLSKGAQMLAQGSAEQSHDAEHLQSFIDDVNKKAELSYDVATKTLVLASEIKDRAGDGRIKMNRLKDAAVDVHLASQSIEEVTKAIENIAFQTNILSLNAAIEAARAGVHGKGFSVVSDEVRSLAGKSSEAAGETSEFVEDSISKTEIGMKLAKAAADAFSSIADGVEDATALAEELGEHVEAQKEALNMIRETTGQLGDIIHQNSVAAEETATSTDEMNSQIKALENLISGFILDK